MKKLMLVGAVAACLGAQATEYIVHDCNYDLTGNTANRSTYTNEYGGVWYFSRSHSVQATADHPRYLLESYRRKMSGTTTYQGINGPSRASTVSPQLPYIVVNRNTATYNNHSPFGSQNPLRAMEIATHPGNVADSWASVIGFRVPRQGTYTLDVDGYAGQKYNSDLVVALLVNNEIIDTKTLNLAVEMDDPARKYKVAIDRELEPGDLVELVMHAGQGAANDMFLFYYKISEPLPEGAQVINPATSLQVEVAHETTSNPWPDVVHGSWKALFEEDFSWFTKFYDNVSEREKGYTAASGLKGVAFNNGGSVAPYTLVEPNNQHFINSEWNNGYANVPLRPGEIVVHPSRQRTQTMIYSPGEAGVYDIGVSMRDAAWTPKDPAGADSEDGIILVIRRGDEILGQMDAFGFATATEDKLGRDSSNSLFIEGVDVANAYPLEFSVLSGPKHNNSSDATCLKIVLVKRPVTKTVYDGNLAMVDNFSKATPTAAFNYGGAAWDIGQYGFAGGSCKGAFKAFTTLQQRWDGNSPSYKALGINNSSSPYIGVNLSGSDQSASVLGNGAQFTLGKNEMFSHPSGGQDASALRFHAPADGVYAAHGAFQHVNGGTGIDFNKNPHTGNDVHILVSSADDTNRGYPANDLSHAAWDKRGEIWVGNEVAHYQQQVQLKATELYLRQGDIVAFAVGANGDYASDGNGLYGWIEGEGTVRRRVNVDINGGASAATFSGRGRVGYADDRWVGFRVANGATEVTSRQLRRDDGTGVGTKLTLAKAGGISASTDAGEASALFKDGVTSTGTADQTSYTISGLVPGEAYDLYFHCRANGLFTANGATAGTTGFWSDTVVADHACLKGVLADGEGKISGTFCSSDASEARWAGLQIAGDAYGAYDPTGLLLMFR